jgi:hypothetical protein
VSGLRPRPLVPDDVAEAVRAAVAQVVAESRATAEPKEAWRFSGRWFSAHPIRTRSRPG